MRGRGKVWQSVFERSMTKLRRGVASCERQKKSPKGPKKVTNGPQSEPQKVSKWSPKGLKVVSKRFQSGFQKVNSA